MEFQKHLQAIRIVGKGPSWATEPNAYFREEKDTEVWGVGTIFRTHRNVDRLFFLHDLRQDIIFEDKNLIDNLVEYGKPVYSNASYSGFCERFPVDDLLSEYKIHYFSNTLSWMLALAIMLEPDVISLHGVDYLDAIQYVQEKACVEFWLGAAMMKGIKIETQDGANILTTDSVYGPIYGFVPLRKKDGLIMEYMPEFLDGTRPQLLKRYKLVPAN